jgi:hypothetical protein
METGHFIDDLSPEIVSRELERNSWSDIEMRLLDNRFQLPKREGDFDIGKDVVRGPRDVS